MSLFKIQLIDRARKVLIKASSLTALCEQGAAKLGCNPSDGGYKVVLNEDGTEIDEDETLLEIASCHTSGILELILLKPNEVWRPINAGQSAVSPASAESSNAASGETANAERSGDTPVPSVEPIERGTQIPWERFPKKLLEACKKDQVPTRRDKRELNKILADYIIHVLKQPTLRVVKSVVSAIVKKYPQSFRDKIGGSEVGDGLETFCQKLYNAVQYARLSTSEEGLQPKKRSRSKKSPNTEEGEKEEQQVDDVEEVEMDEYGCTAWQPGELPAGETEETQEKKRDWLCTHYRFRDGENNPSQVEDFMKKTYCTQRADIINRKMTVDKVLICWPYLREPRYFLQHASILLGKEVVDVWDDSMRLRAPQVLRYLASACSERKLKGASEAQKKRLQEMRKIAEEAQESSSNLKSDLPKRMALFPMIATYFREDFGKLVLIAPTVPSEETLLTLQSEPYVLFVGRSLYEEKPPVIMIVSDQKTLMEVNSLAQGLLCCICVYYVFGMKYPESLGATLEFLQRVMLGINPQRGNRRTKKKKQVASTVHPVLKTFLERLEIFEDALAMEE